jgi:hypothetical protein
MELEFRWEQPIVLARNKKLTFDPHFMDSLLVKVPQKPGVYYFSRKFGHTYQPFYIGETGNLRARLKSHLKSADIREILRGIQIPGLDVKQGTKHFHFAAFKAKRGQQAKKCMGIVQKYLIEQATTKGYPLLNVQLTVMRTHSVIFSGRRSGRGPFPSTFDVAV